MDARCPPTGPTSGSTSSRSRLRPEPRFCRPSGARKAEVISPAIPTPPARQSGDYRQFKDVQFHPGEVTYVSLGDGTTSEGEFWEALNTASNRRLPVLFCVQDNEYAISVPVETQTPGGNISRLVANFPNFHFEEIDGTDPDRRLRGHQARRRALPRRAMVRHSCTRMSSVPYSHSLSDDERLYRPDTERQRDAARDPVPRLQMFLLREGILDEKGINQIEKEVEEANPGSR